MSAHEFDPEPQDHTMDDVDLTDRWLSTLAAGGELDAVGSEPTTATDLAAAGAVAALLRTASGPAGAGELAGDQLFLRAFDEQADAAQERRRTPRTVTVLGKAVAVKAAAIAAVAALGVAGAGAATGAIMHVVNERNTDPVVTIDDVSTDEALDDAGGIVGPDGRSTPSAVAVARVPLEERTQTCAAAVDAAGLSALASAAASVGGTPAEYCRGTATAADPDRAGTPVDPSDPAGSDDEAGNGATNGNSPQAGGNPVPGGNGGNGNPDPGGNGAANGNSPQAGGNPNPGSNANPGGNGNANPGGGGNGNPNPGGNGAANPGGTGGTGGNGNPNPGGNGAANGNSPRAGGNPDAPGNTKGAAADPAEARSSGSPAAR